MSAAGVVTCAGITRRFGAHVALHPLTLTLGPGGITGLLGPNGSGKSTFLRLLLGLLRPDAGTAELDGAPLVGDGLAVRQRATYLPGELHVYGELDGHAHLEWSLRVRA
ncbi:MAG: ATP-binding cassette domain-containing protein, partial [Planctomycetota bacterium]